MTERAFNQVNTKKNRLAYVDYAKAVLVLFVVFGHLLSGINKQVSGDPIVENLLLVKQLAWVPYYMSAFFVLTGFCSNFDKSIKDIIWGGFKTIKVPGIIFGFFYVLGPLVNHGVFSISVAFKNVVLLPFHCGYWFLDTLFLSRILFWLVCKISCDRWLRLLWALVLFVTGFAIECMLDGYDDFFSIIHALLMTFFIAIGFLIKSYKNVFSKKGFVVGGFIYVIGVILVYLVYSEVPSVTHRIEINNFTVVPFLLLSFFGTVFIVSFCVFFKENRILEYIGRNSLVFYCAHLILLSFVIRFSKNFYGQSSVASCLALVVAFFSLVALCLGISWLLNRKKFSFILGKF